MPGVKGRSTMGEGTDSRPETLEPARWREAAATSLGLVFRAWGLCGDDADEADDAGSLSGGLGCWCIMDSLEEARAGSSSAQTGSVNPAG